MHFSILNIGRGGYASSRNTITRQPRTTEPGGDRRDDHPQTVSEGHRRSRRRRAARAPTARPRAGQPAEPADHHALEPLRPPPHQPCPGLGGRPHPPPPPPHPHPPP